MLITTSKCSHTCKDYEKVYNLFQCEKCLKFIFLGEEFEEFEDFCLRQSKDVSEGGNK